VGTLAVQFAKLCGARVLACASRKDGAALARKLGADEAVDGRHADIAAAVRSFAADGLAALIHRIAGIRWRVSHKV
jgi:NADPH2:quinone reductase